MSYLVRVQLAHNWGGVDPAVAMTVARAIREMMTKTNNPDKVIRCDKESGVSYSCNRFVKKELEQGGYLPGGWMRYDAWGVIARNFCWLGNCNQM